MGMDSIIKGGAGMLHKLLWTDTSGRQYTEVDWTQDHDRIGSSIQRLIGGPGRFVVKEVLVVDSGDCTVFKWTQKGGVIHG